jgi:hypothetical protein
MSSSPPGSLCRLQTRSWDVVVTPLEAAWDEYDKRLASHERLLCRDAKDDDDQECSKAIWEIGRRIFAMPACTFQGMAVKLRAGERLGLEDFADPDESFLSIAADIRRLVDGGAA